MNPRFFHCHCCQHLRMQVFNPIYLFKTFNWCQIPFSSSFTSRIAFGWFSKLKPAGMWKISWHFIVIEAPSNSTVPSQKDCSRSRRQLTTLDSMQNILALYHNPHMLKNGWKQPFWRRVESFSLCPCEIFPFNQHQQIIRTRSHYSSRVLVVH